ncbi:MAG: hypothetical protein ABIK28_07145 [Planctomycetota bacterium]
MNPFADEEDQAILPGITRYDAENRSHGMGRADLAWLLIVSSIGIAWTAFHFDRGLDVFDAGLFATEAERVLDGGVYGKDFIAPYGPGRYYFIALLFSLFGCSLKVQAFLWLALRGIVAGLVFMTGRHFFPRILALLPALVVIAAPGALHKSFFQMTALLNILCYLHYRKDPSLLSCGFAGLIIAAGSLFRVDVGFFGSVSFLLLLCIEPLWCSGGVSMGTLSKRMAAFVTGAAFLLLPVFFYFLARADVGEIFQAEWHRTLNVSGFAGYLHVPDFSEAFDAGYPASAKLFLTALMLRTAPWVYALLAAIVLVRRVRGDDRDAGLAALAVVVFGVPLLNQVRITPTFNHLLHAIPLVLVAWTMSFFLLRHLLPSGRRVRAAGAAVFIAMPLAVPVYYNLAHTQGLLPGSFFSRSEFTEPIPLERAGLYETPEHARKLERIVHYIQSTTQPGEPVFTGPFIPVLNFLAARPPAVRFLEPFYYFRSEFLQQKVIQDLMRSRPRLIIIDPEAQVGRQSLEADAPLVFDFIKQHYRMLSRPGSASGPYTLWLLNE